MIVEFLFWTAWIIGSICFVIWLLCILGNVWYQNSLERIYDAIHGYQKNFMHTAGRVFWPWLISLIYLLTYYFQ